MVYTWKGVCMLIALKFRNLKLKKLFILHAMHVERELLESALKSTSFDTKSM